jgi:hypothetical protein
MMVEGKGLEEQKHHQQWMKLAQMYQHRKVMAQNHQRREEMA